MDTHFVVLLTAFLVMSIVLLMYTFRRHAVPTFVAIWLLFPNWGQGLFGYIDLPQFRFVELTAACMLLVISLMSKKNSQNNLRVKIDKYVAFTALAAISVIILTPVSLFKATGLSEFGSEFSVGYLISNTTNEISGIFFLIGCLCLVKTRTDLEAVLKVFVLCALVTSFEFISIITFRDYLGPVSKYSFNDKNLFFSLFLNDYYLVGILNGFATIISGYFYFRTKKKVWLLFMLMSFLMTATTISRGVVLGTFIAAAVMVLMIVSFKQLIKIFMAIPLLIFVVYVTPLSSLFLSATESAAENVGGHIVSRAVAYDSSDSSYSRWGLQLRALDVISHTFPFGVGNNMLRYHMSDLSISQSFRPDDTLLLVGYLRPINGDTTNSHSGILEQIASYGLLGIFVMFVYSWIILITGAFRANCDSVRHLQGFLVGGSLFFFLYYVNQGYPRFYIGLFIMLLSAKILDELRKNIITERILIDDKSET